MLERNLRNNLLQDVIIRSGSYSIIEESLTRRACNFVFFRYFFDMELDLIYILIFTYTLCVRLLLNERTTDNPFSDNLKILVPRTDAGSPWPDSYCDYSICSLYKPDDTTKSRAIKARLRTRVYHDEKLIVFPHFVLEYRVGDRESFNNKMQFTMAGALDQARDLGLDMTNYAVYGGLVDLSARTVTLYAMVTEEVRFCRRRLCHPPHENLRGLPICFFFLSLRFAWRIYATS